MYIDVPAPSRDGFPTERGAGVRCVEVEVAPPGACRVRWANQAPGKAFEVTTFQTSDHLIVNFPTKLHWRDRSRVEDVKAGLVSLRRLLAERRVLSVAVPALGCNNGGLSWAVVRPLVVDAMATLDDVAVKVYEPFDESQAPDPPPPRSVK